MAKETIPFGGEEQDHDMKRVSLLKLKLDKMIEQGIITRQKAKEMLNDLKPPSRESEGNVKMARKRLKSVEDQAASIWEHHSRKKQ